MRSLFVRVICGTVVGLVLLEVAWAGNWARFRGPNGAGIAEDRDIPVKWEAQNVLWKTALPGIGHSSPIVWNDRLFLQTASEDGKERALLCLSTRTGKIEWTAKTQANRAKTHQFNSMASSTPATDGERVYCVIWPGGTWMLKAYDFTGKQLWARDLGVYTSQHGPGHSPVVHDGRVYLNNDQDGTAVLQAFDAKSGERLWEVKRPPYRACYSTPCLNVRPDGRTELLVASTAGVGGYDPATGKEIWNYTWTHTKMPQRTVASPVVADGVVLVNGGDGSGTRHAIAVKLGGSGDVSQTHLAWENTRSLPYVPCLLSRGKYLYSVIDKDFVACHVARTGEQVWGERLGSNATASPVLIDGKIYAVGNDGKVYVLAAEPEYKRLAINTLGEPVTATPAVGDGRLFIRGQQHLFCIGKAE